MGEEFEDPSRAELTKEEMLKSCRVYRDDTDHLILVLEKRAMPQTINHLCSQCQQTQPFKITREPDLVDIRDEHDHWYSLSPRLVKEKSGGQDIFPHLCLACGERKLFKIDWQTRERELRAWRIDLATSISK